MKAITEEEYRKLIHENMEILDKAIASGEYPHLTALLLSYGKSLYNKLSALYKYFGSYGEDERQRMSYYEGRGWEMMLSYDTMTTLGAGTDKATWKKAIDKLCDLQMFGRFRPRSGKYSFLNSSVQQLSADRAEKEGRNAVIWYRVPRYTDKLLQIAEGKALHVKVMGNGINKDAIRDAEGDVKANRITDTGYDIHPDTAYRREALARALEMWMRIDGYATAKKVIDSAIELEDWKGFSYERWVETWKAYKPKLFADLGLKEGRPSKAEKERWALKADSWIIRKAAEE